MNFRSKMLQRLKLVNVINQYHNGCNVDNKPTEYNLCLSNLDIVDKANLELNCNNICQNIGDYVDYKTLLKQSIENKRNNYDNNHKRCFIRKYAQCVTNEDARIFLIKYLTCHQCMSLMIALESNEHFDQHVINFTSSAQKPYEFFVKLANINSKKQLLEVIKNMALENNLIIFGSATIDELSGIDANDLDIATSYQKYIKFAKILKQYFTIKNKSLFVEQNNESNESDEEFNAINYFNGIKIQIIHNNIELNIDFISHQYLETEQSNIDFEATSFFLKHEEGTQYLELRTQYFLSDNRTIFDVLNDVKNKILRFANKRSYSKRIDSLHTLLRVLNRASKKQEAGWIIPDGIPMNVFEHVSYAITNKQFIEMCNIATKSKLSIDIWKIIVSYVDHCSDNYNKSLCNNESMCNHNECDNGPFRDFMFIHPCCNQLECITCAAKGIKKLTENTTFFELIQTYSCAMCRKIKQIHQ